MKCLKDKSSVRKDLMKRRAVMRGCNRRQRVLLGLACSAAFLFIISVGGVLCTEMASAASFEEMNLAPCPAHPFGTDWMGRDMFARTLKGLSISIFLGLLAAGVSSCIALVLGLAAALAGERADGAVTFLIDLIMGVPHILLLILISVALGKGFTGVTVGVALTHWPSMTRLVRGEVLQLRESAYIQIARKLGKSNWYIARKHMLPHLLPQFLVGLVLLFPHAVLHESSITFLGFGLSSEQPAIGIVLSESMKYLVTGQWWLALFPGVLLVTTVMMFYVLGENLRKLADPGSVHE